MPSKKRFSKHNPREKARPYVQEFINICDINTTLKEWDLDPFEDTIKEIQPQEFVEFIRYFKEFSSDGGIEYTMLVNSFDKYFDFELKRLAKKWGQNAQSDSLYEDLDHGYRTGLYKVDLWLAILTKVLPYVDLPEGERDKIRQDILHGLFEHLPGCLEIAIKSYTALEDGVEKIEKIDHLLPIFQEFVFEYSANAPKDLFLARSIRLLSALAKGYEFSLIMKSDEAPKLNHLFFQHSSMVHDLLSSIKETHFKKDLMAKLTQLESNHKNAKERVDSNPFVSLFPFYEQEWIDKVEGEQVVDIDAEGAALLALLDNDSLLAQSEFVERFKILLRQYNAVFNKAISLDLNNQYMEVVRSIYNKCLAKNLPKDDSMAFAIRNIILLIVNNIHVNSQTPVIQKISLCYDILRGVPLNQEKVPTIEEFEVRCKDLAMEYEAYANSNPPNWFTTRHLELVTRLEQVVRDFKSLPGERLEFSAKVLYTLMLSIIKRYKNDQYQQMATQMQSLLLMLLKMKQANSNPPASTPEEAKPLVGLAQLVEPTPEPPRAQAQEEPAEQEQALEIMAESFGYSAEQDAMTPVISAEQTPEISPAISPNVQPQEVASTQHLQESMSKEEIDSQVALLAQQLSQTRIAQREEQALANQSEIDVHAVELEDRLKAVQLSHDKKLKAQQCKNEKALEEAKAFITNQYDKKFEKANKRQVKKIEKLKAKFLAEKEALPAKVKKAQQEKLARKHEEYQAQLSELRAKNSADLQAYRAQLESQQEMDDLTLEFQKRMTELQSSFYAAQKSLPVQVHASRAKQYEAELQSQHQVNLATLHQYRLQVEFEVQRQHQENLLKQQHEMQVAKAAILAQAQKRRQATDLVLLPLPLISILNQIKAGVVNRLQLRGYYTCIKQLFISPNCVENFNLIYNLGFLTSVIPTIPNRYAIFIDQQHPALLAFWRQELNELNNLPKHEANILALFLLLPILACQPVGSTNEHIQYSINQFVACFDTDEPANKNALTKALEFILLDKEVVLAQGMPSMRNLGLYHKFQLFEQQYTEKLESSHEALNVVRGYHPQYANEGISVENVPQTNIQQKKSIKPH